MLDNYLQASATAPALNADKDLHLLIFIGKLELQKTGDGYTSELAQFYGSASPEQRKTLKEARELMKRGRASYAQAKPLEAITHFERAKSLFQEARDPWESQYAGLWIGYSLLNAAETHRSLKVLEDLLASFERQNYNWLVMRARHILSGAQYNLGKYSRAIELNLSALRLASEMGDALGAFNVLSILIEQYRYIGNYDEALKCIRMSLPLLADLTNRVTNGPRYFPYNRPPKTSIRTCCMIDCSAVRLINNPKSLE